MSSLQKIRLKEAEDLKDLKEDIKDAKEAHAFAVKQAKEAIEWVSTTWDTVLEYEKKLKDYLN